MVDRGLTTLLSSEPGVTVVTRGLGDRGVATTSASPGPLVAIFDEQVCCGQAPWTLAPSVGVIVLARAPAVPYGSLLTGVGVSCLDLSVSEQDLLEMIRLTAQGGCVFLAHDGRRVTRPDGDAQLLTEREWRVLGLLSHGDSYAGVAAHLNISVETVRKHAGSVYRKLDAPGKTHLLGLPVDWLERQCSRGPGVTFENETP